MESIAGVPPLPCSCFELKLKNVLTCQMTRALGKEKARAKEKEVVEAVAGKTRVERAGERLLVVESM